MVSIIWICSSTQAPARRTIRGKIQNFTAGYKVKVVEDNEKIRQKLFAIANGNDLEILAMEDVRLLVEAKLQSMSVVLYTLSAFIALFSLINLANTLLTNLIARQQELGVLQSIGMSNHQLKALLQMECLLYVIGTILMTGTVGTLAGALLCSVLDRSGWFGSVMYRFPVWVFAAYILLLLTACFAYQSYAVRTCTKRSLIERINMQ